MAFHRAEPGASIALMPAFIWAILGVFATVLVLFVLGWLNAIRASVATKRKLDEMTNPAVEAVLAGHSSAQDLVAKAAEVPATRNRLFARLREVGKADVFPVSFRTAENVAESDLSRWLMHPNELGTPPSEIELITTVPVKGVGSKTGSLMLFRFRTDAPHWASKRGWMAGIAGPYWHGDEPRKARVRLPAVCRAARRCRYRRGPAQAT